MPSEEPIFTIGHSSHTWERFHGLIGLHGIECIVDVRSNPVSRWTHFNRHELSGLLEGVGISYRHFGDRLSGRLGNRPANYERIARTSAFAEGIDDVLALAAQRRVALLCAEYEPLECHRCLLVARNLAGQRRAPVSHLLRNGDAEPHARTEERLLAMHGGAEDLFLGAEERLAHAYRRQAARLGSPTS